MIAGTVVYLCMRNPIVSSFQNSSLIGQLAGLAFGGRRAETCSAETEVERRTVALCRSVASLVTLLQVAVRMHTSICFLPASCYHSMAMPTTLCNKTCQNGFVYGCMCNLQLWTGLVYAILVPSWSKYSLTLGKAMHAWKQEIFSKTVKAF